MLLCEMLVFQSFLLLFLWDDDFSFFSPFLTFFCTPHEPNEPQKHTHTYFSLQNRKKERKKTNAENTNSGRRLRRFRRCFRRRRIIAKWWWIVSSETLLSAVHRGGDERHVFRLRFLQLILFCYPSSTS